MLQLSLAVFLMELLNLQIEPSTTCVVPIGVKVESSCEKRSWDFRQRMEEQSVNDNPDGPHHGYSDKDAYDVPCDKHIDSGPYLSKEEKQNG
jgi:hypothetical protein